MVLKAQPKTQTLIMKVTDDHVVRTHRSHRRSSTVPSHRLF